MGRLRGPAVRAEAAAAMAVYLGFVAISLLQQPGLTTYDTRLELTERPGSFLASAFSLWQPDVDFGELQNQANGYLFPQGPFFWLGDVLHVAPWVTQRLWSALVVIAACEGMRRVCRSLDLPQSAAFLGGLAFAFSPRLIGTAGVLSAEALPGALTPWALLPLVLVARGRLRARSAMILGAAAVVAMGGVNAVETGAALVPAAVLAVWAATRRLVSWRFVAGWIGMVVASTLWWTLPLFMLGRYSPPFYEYVESAITTTGFVGWSEAIRGNSHWLSWQLLQDGRPWWPAAHSLATDPVLVIVSTVVTAAGLIGLARWQDCYRIPFAFSAAVGLAAITVGHGGAAGTPFAGDVRNALDGVLQIFRNVHKFDPSVRLAVAVGAAALFSEIVARVDVRFTPGVAGKWVVLPACVVLVLGAPVLANNARTPGWKSVPTSWVDAREWLAAHAGNGAALVVPASGFALQSWGATFDEPVLALNVRDRVAYTQAPLVPGQTQRFLSALNESITSGSAVDLGEELARAGIAYVIVRGDLDRVETGTPNPSQAESALVAGGLSKVAAFGADSVAPVSIYRVGHERPRLRGTPAAQVLTVAGEPESVLALQDAGLVRGAVVLQGEPGWDRSPDVVTDGAQRRERQFGSLYGSRSVVMQAGEPYRVERATHDFPGAPRARQVVAEYAGLASLRASSSRGYADTFGAVITAEGPAAAIDGDPLTRWVTSPASEPTRQWLRMTFRAPRSVHRVSVQPVIGDPALAPIRRIEVDAGTQRQTLDVSPAGATSVARFDGSPVTSVTVRIRRVGSGQQRVPVALAGVHVDDLVPRATQRVPDPLGPGIGFAFRTDPGTRPCIGTSLGPDCDESRRRTAEEPAGLDRTVEVKGSDTVVVTGSVVAAPSRRAMRLLEPVGREQRIRASSVFGNDPRVSSRFAWDGTPETAWVPADNDAGPTLVFRWNKERKVSGIRVESPDPETAPARALVRTGDGRHVDVRIRGSAWAAFPVIRTRRLEVTFQRPADGARLVLAEVALAGADVTQPFDPNAVTGAVCGLGPHVSVDNVVHQSRVLGTLGDIADGRPLRLSVCDPNDGGVETPIDLAPGKHSISAPPTAEFRTMTVTGAAPGDATIGTTRSIEIRTWSGTRRTAYVDAGSATVVSMATNANTGWRATLAGKELRPIRVDGWQQGWLVPDGPGGRLEISFPAQRWYRVLLIGGLLPAALTMLGAVFLMFRRRWSATDVAPELGGARPRIAVGLMGALLLALGGASAVGALLAWLGRRRPWPVVSGGLAVMTSGLLDARHAAAPSDGVADLLAAAGFGLLFATALRQPRPEES